MVLTPEIFLWLLVFGLVVVLDLLILRVWHGYKQLLKTQESTGVTINRWATLKQALAAAFRITPRGHSLQGAPAPRMLRGPLPGSRLLPRLRQTILSWSVVNLILAVLVLYAAQYYMVQIPNSRQWGLAALVGGMALVYFRYRMAEPSRPDWTDGLQIGLGFLIVLPLALDVDRWMLAARPHMQIALWLLGILLVAVPALKLDPKGLAAGWRPAEAMGRGEWALLAALLLGAFLLRVIRLDALPGPVDPDEASLGLFLMDVLAGKYTQPFGTGWATHPALQWFLVAPLTGLFQRPIFLMRFPAVIYGTLAVGGLYMAARMGWGRRVAIIAGVLMMTSDVEIHFSRLGVNNISDSLFATWTVAALWAAARTGNPAAYVLTGLGMGLGQYYYFGNRSLPFVVAASLILWALTHWHRFRQAWKHVVIIFLVFLMVIGPLLGLMIR
ncbi:MAG: glycosyltransferase family 39 protein, partial [Anaerolineales bacterium]|nr:glycosyltransferase family 39 protein [Anaerolineales bacterium]